MSLTQNSNSTQGQINEFPADSSLDMSSADDNAAEHEILHRVLALIRVEFEETTWNAFWRTTVDGRSTDQVAAEIGISVAAVRQARYRVLRRLRVEMRDEGVG